jgi:hypothetical protein
MKAKIEITYDNGRSEVRHFETDKEAIEALRLCEARYQAERRGETPPERTRLKSFLMLP